MEDISKKEPAFRRRTPGIVVASIVVGIIIFGATWLSFTNSDNSSTGITQNQHPSEPVERSDNHGSSAGHADTESSASQAAAAEDTPEDEVDIALGGRWQNNDCTFVPVQIVKASTGELVDAMDCQRSSPKPVHAYEAYSDKALAALAYSDPMAAMVLGRRLATTDPEQSWDLLIRASALLGGDTRPIKWLAATSFNQVKADDGMATDTMQMRYVLDALTQRLDRNPDQSFDFREHYLRTSLSEDEFDQLDRMVDSLLEKMKAIEEEITGKDTIREDVS
jgi:hypothetical protein